MAKKKKKFEFKNKDIINEALDIVENTEDDNQAMIFLKETVGDDYPDLDLGRMDLHEAIKELSGKQSMVKSKSNSNMFEDLNASLGDFINVQEKNIAKIKKMSKKKRVKKKSKRKKKK